MVERYKTLLGRGFLLCLCLAPLEATALPANTRQIAEGYWIGGAPSDEGLEALAEEGVRLVVSLYEIGPEARHPSDGDCRAGSRPGSCASYAEVSGSLLITHHEGQRSKSSIR